MAENKVDPKLQDELLETLGDLKETWNEAQEVAKEAIADRDKAREELAEQAKRLDALENRLPAERKIKPLNWDTDMKNQFGKWYLDAITKADNQTEGTAASGGNLVPTEYTPEIFRIIGEQSFILSQSRVVPMNRLVLTLPAAGSTGASVAWTAEETAATQSKVTFDLITLTAQRLDAYSLCSNELIEDATPDIVDYLVELFTEAIGEEIDNQGFAGTGSPVSGVTTAKAGYSVAFDAGSLSWSLLKAKYLSEAISKVKPSVLNGALWVMHPTALHYVRQLGDDNNQPIFQYPNQAGQGQLYGYPIHVRTKMPSTATGASKPMMVFGNFKKGFLVGMRKQIEVESSRHLKILENQTAIVYRMRLDMEVALTNCFCRVMTPAA